MDDLVINFASDAASSNYGHAASSKKGGRWTDRLKERRKSESIHRQEKKKLQGPADTETREAVASQGDFRGIKRSREAFEDGGSVVQAGAAITPAARTKLNAQEPNNSDAKAQPVTGNKGISTGKRQYISSLFTAEGIPTASHPSGPHVPGLPSNAPLTRDHLQNAGVEPPPAPALTGLGILPEIAGHLVKKLSIADPTACQTFAIPPLLQQPSQAKETPDLILQSQTGSGKTLSFLIPILQDLLTFPESVCPSNPTRAIGTLALILAPTRELALQTYNVICSLLTLPNSSSFSVPPHVLTPCLLVGGANRTHEKSRLRKGCPIVVATPGRLLDHLRTTESFRLAGEPPKSKPHSFNPPSQASRELGLRWLVIDECDRLMDLGFEEQMKGVLEELERRSAGKPRRRTVLCSATASEGVDRLAGIALINPTTIQGDSARAGPAGRPADDNKAKFDLPTQLLHNYVVCPPKLRFVGLVALLRRIITNPKKLDGKGSKTLVFLSCTDAVDFYWRALGSMQLGSSDDNTAEKTVADDPDKVVTSLAKYCDLFPSVPIYRLHGNLDLPTRLSSWGAFSKASHVKAGEDVGKSTEDAILLCTSVAARGLDVPFVSHVVQYDLPTVGGVTEYVHRVGRTARAGAAGQAYSFLLPSEKEWVPWVTETVQSAAGKGARSLRLREVGIDEILREGYGGDDREFESRATDVQMGFERWVNQDTENAAIARNAFASHVRAYATHPAAEKTIFNSKALHLGHVAKSFGMREAPGGMTRPLKTRSTAATGSKVRPSRASASKLKPSSHASSAREIAQRVVSSLANSKTSSGFETGRRKGDVTSEAKAKKLMKGLSAITAKDFQVASADLVSLIAYSNESKKRRLR